MLESWANGWPRTTNRPRASCLRGTSRPGDKQDSMATCHSSLRAHKGTRRFLMRPLEAYHAVASLRRAAAGRGSPSQRASGRLCPLRPSKDRATACSDLPWSTGLAACSHCLAFRHTRFHLGPPPGRSIDLQRSNANRWSKVILSVASSGTCAPQDCAWTARSPRRHKALPRTQSKSA